MLYTIVILFVNVIILSFILKHKNKRRHRIFYSTCLMTSMILILTMLLISGIAIKHGADAEALKKFNPARTIKAIKNSPVAAKDNNVNQIGNIIIYYRFGCKDCEAIYNDLEKMVNENENIYWVPSRSSLGTELLQKYTVEEVPSGVIIQNDNDYTQYVLYKTISEDANRSDDNYTIVDVEAFNRLLELQRRVKER